VNVTENQFLRASLLIFFACVLLDAVLAEYVSQAVRALVIGILGAVCMVPLLAIRFQQLGFSRAWGLVGLLLPLGFMIALPLYLFGDELEQLGRGEKG
jgi:hypothetical protein